MRRIQGTLKRHCGLIELSPNLFVLNNELHLNRAQRLLSKEFPDRCLFCIIGEFPSQNSKAQLPRKDFFALPGLGCRNNDEFIPSIQKVEFIASTSLDVMLSIARSVRAWISEDGANVAIMCCVDRALLGRVAACALCYAGQFGSAKDAHAHVERALRHSWLKDMFTSHQILPSLNLFFETFTKIVQNNPNFVVPELFLRELVVHKLPAFGSKGCRLMITIMQGNTFLYTSMLQGGGIKWVETSSRRPSTKFVPIGIAFRGEITIKAYHIPEKMRSHTPRALIFETTIHTGALTCERTDSDDQRATQLTCKVVTHPTGETPRESTCVGYTRPCGINSLIVSRGELDSCAGDEQQKIYHRKFRVEIVFGNSRFSETARQKVRKPQRMPTSSDEKRDIECETKQNSSQTEPCPGDEPSRPCRVFHHVHQHRHHHTHLHTFKPVCPRLRVTASIENHSPDVVASIENHPSDVAASIENHSSDGETSIENHPRGVISEDNVERKEVSEPESSNSRTPDPQPERPISPSDDSVLSSSLRSLGLLPSSPPSDRAAAPSPPSATFSSDSEATGDGDGDDAFGELDPATAMALDGRFNDVSRFMKEQRDALSGFHRNRSSSRSQMRAEMAALRAILELGGLSARDLTLSSDEETEQTAVDFLRSRRHRHRGATSSQIRALPLFRLTEKSSQIKNGVECLICRQPFQAKEQLRTLPCIHSYHRQCADHWLKIKKKCPVCDTKIDDSKFRNIPS
eukprot:928849_1